MLLAIGHTESRLLSSCHVLNPWAHREQGLLLSSSVHTSSVASLPGWVPEVFFSVGATELSGEAARASCEAARKKPLVPTDKNLTSMPTPISLD